MQAQHSSGQVETRGGQHNREIDTEEESDSARQTDNTVKSDQSATVSPPSSSCGRWVDAMYDAPARPPEGEGMEGNQGGRERDTPHIGGRAGRAAPVTDGTARLALVRSIPS
uniref:Uncharacterized protein n=1 Tax=Vitrella brassicaformis TaxID=1169539 RepID=A0A7S1JPK8_9ALVE|mmetsp:Transcript_16295/g.39008  ORF Transcript_16295/g.39008 Transcript_16295/m.39008 type:complete len:112 (+) Transcript_16295:88-423(+)